MKKVTQEVENLISSLNVTGIDNFIAKQNEIIEKSYLDHSQIDTEDRLKNVQTLKVLLECKMNITQLKENEERRKQLEKEKR